jgi:riboflavin synthase
MFTGIIQQLGRVVALDRNDFGAVLRVDPGDWRHRPALGDSIAVNGCCLTVAQTPMLRFDVIRQTLDVTTLGDLNPGDEVNLEHAVSPTTMLGGHIVQGHVDALGHVIRVTADDTQYRLRIEPTDPAAMDCIIAKGSIAVSGVSLTVAQLGESWFEVALIPTTLQLTNLGRLREGDRVNLETDYVAKVVVNWLRRSAK